MRGRTRASARLVAAELEQRWNARLRQHRWSTGAHVVELVSAGASDDGAATARPLACVFFAQPPKDPAYREGACAERGEITLAQAAAQLKVSEDTVRRLISDASRAARFSASARSDWRF
jgi:hypothetical protein